MCKSIIFTEVSYKPNQDISNKSQFIEFKNIGTLPVLLTGAILKIKNRNNYTFPTVLLQPNSFYVVAFFSYDFKLDYGNFANDTHQAQFGM
jgi:hypothetical protein